MKVPLVLVFTFIFALKLHHSECKLVISMYPHKDSQLSLDITLDIENIFNENKLTENEIFWPWPKKQSTLNPNVFVDNFKKILTEVEDEIVKNNNNDVIAPEEQSTFNPNEFVDNFKKILTQVEDGSDENNNDDVIIPEEQSTLSPCKSIDKCKKLLTHIENGSKENNKDDFIVPEEQSTPNPKEFVDNFKIILTRVEGGSDENNNEDAMLPEQHSTPSPNEFFDNFKKISTHVEDVSEENNNNDDIVPDEQSTPNPKAFVDNFKKILTQFEDGSDENSNDDVIVPKEQSTQSPYESNDKFKKIITQVEDGSDENYKDDVIVTEEPYESVDDSKKILTKEYDGSKENNNDDVIVLQEKSTLNPNEFFDNSKKKLIHVENGLKKNNNDVVITPEKQSTVKPNEFVDNFKKILPQDEDVSDEHNNIDTSAPEERIEYKCSDEIVTYMSTLRAPELIEFHGYPVESHKVVTDDGYILTIHRIPFPKTSKNKVSPKKTVLLHHGLFGSSVHWLIPGPMKGLGYILSDAGYDVWMANVRGNIYSRAHVSKHIKSREFWDFTFHEVSQHDLPAVIDYIMEVKGSDVKINYIGHSMGTTVLFALLSTQTQYNKVLRAGFALAPVAYMTHIRGPLKRLAKYCKSIHRFMKLLGGGNEFLPQNSFFKWLSEGFIELMNDDDGTFEESLSVLFGHDVGQFNKTLLPLIVAHANAGASTKTVLHYAQEIKHRGKFQMFDYGFWNNLRKYGTSPPPEYPLHKITLPIALFSGENDWLSSVIDAKRLYEQLVNPIEHYIVPLKEFNHGDFLWAIDAPSLLYARLLYLLEEGVNQLDSPDI